MFWYGVVLHIDDWHMKMQQWLLQIMRHFCFLTVIFFSTITETLTASIKNTVIIVREENFGSETITAHGVLWPADPTCWTALRRKSRIRAMLIQLGLRLLLANLLLQDKEINTMGLRLAE